MFVQVAEDLKVDDAANTLRLVKVGQQILYFSDRPVRIAGHLKMSEFLDEWTSKAGKDNFGADPPNAVLSVYEPGQADSTLVVVEISHPQVDGADIVYNYKLIKGKLPASRRADGALHRLGRCRRRRRGRLPRRRRRRARPRRPLEAGKTTGGSRENLEAPVRRVRQRRTPVGSDRAALAEDVKTVEVLFVQTARQAVFEGTTLTLKDVSPSTLFFSDRPERIAGHYTNDEYLKCSTEGRDSFLKDPPNAVVSTFTRPGADPTDVVVMIRNPRLSGRDLKYDITLIQGNPPAGGGATAVFIDIIGLPFTPLSFAGVARRTAYPEHGLRCGRIECGRPFRERAGADARAEAPGARVSLQAGPHQPARVRGRESEDPRPDHGMSRAADQPRPRTESFGIGSDTPTGVPDPDVRHLVRSAQTGRFERSGPRLHGRRLPGGALTRVLRNDLLVRTRPQPRRRNSSMRSKAPVLTLGFAMLTLVGATASAQPNPDRDAYFGETHIHTSLVGGRLGVRQPPHRAG